MTDQDQGDYEENQLHVPDAFIALYQDARQRLTAPRETIAARHELCEDLANLLTEHCTMVHFRDGVDEETVLSRCHQGLLAEPVTVTASEAGWSCNAPPSCWTGRLHPYPRANAMARICMVCRTSCGTFSLSPRAPPMPPADLAPSFADAAHGRPQRVADGTQPLVRFAGVQKTYDGVQLVVRQLDLDIRRGEFLTLLGPSGSGKTTTLMMLAGFETPTARRRSAWKSTPINAQCRRKNATIGMVFQSYALFPHHDRRPKTSPSP